MTSVEEALLGTIIRELATVLHNCRREVRQIEDALEIWFEGGASRHAFPIAEMQRLDLVYQVQGDLAEITAFTSDVLISGRSFSPDLMGELGELPKLAEIRDRLQRAGSADRSPPTAARARLDDGTGSPELF